MAKVEKVGKPGAVITLTWDEVVGLATLLNTGTLGAVDSLLHLESLQAEVSDFVTDNDGATLGYWSVDERLSIDNYIPF